jgi:hypothetical protein
VRDEWQLLMPNHQPPTRSNYYRRAANTTCQQRGLRVSVVVLPSDVGDVARLRRSLLITRGFFYILLSSFSVRQQLTQAGFVLVFFGVLLVLCALHRRGRPQHCPRRRLHRARRAELLELFLFWHDSYLTMKVSVCRPSLALTTAMGCR